MAKIQKPNLAEQERRLKLATGKLAYEKAKREADIEARKLIAREEVTAAMTRIVELTRHRIIEEAPGKIATRFAESDSPDVASDAKEVLTEIVEQLATDLEGAAG